MRLHDAVRYALYVSREIGGARATRFGAQRKVKLAPSWNERDARYVLQNAALDVITRILNFGFDGSGALRRPIDQGGLNLVGRGAVLSLIVRVMGGTQDREDDVYGVNAPGARSNLAELIERMWKYMRLVKKRDLDPGTAADKKSNGLVDAVEMLLRKFYNGAHLQRQLQSESESGGIVVIKPRVGEAHYAKKKKAWDTFIVPLTVPYDEEFNRLYNARMGLVIAPKERRSKNADQDDRGEPSAKKRRSKKADQDDQGEPSAKKRRSNRAVHVATYDHLVASVVYDACLIGSLLGGHRTMNVALGAEPVDAILAAAGIPSSSYDQDEALLPFILNAVVGTAGRGAASPWVVWCGDFSSRDNFATGTPPPVLVYRDEGTKVSARRLSASAPGSESPLLPGDATHVVFVVDARVVAQWEDAVKFWKNSRGLHYLNEDVDCTWVTVIIAPQKLSPPPNTVVIGTVQLDPAGLVATSFECGENDRQPYRKKLAIRNIRTYDADLAVANIIPIYVGDDTALAALANLKCASVKVWTDRGNGTSTTAKLPMAVVDVRRVAVTDENIDHFVALGTTRNYFMRTTKAQHDNIVAAQSARAPNPAPQVEGADSEQPGQLAPMPVVQKKIPKKLTALASGADMDQTGGATGGKDGARGFDKLRDSLAFEPETVTILKKPVKYMVSVECQLARNESLRGALTGRTSSVTFLRVKSDLAAQGPFRHHAAVMRKLPKKQAIHGTLFYVECVATGEVSFEIVSGGSVAGPPNVSGTMPGAELAAQLAAAEERHKKAKKAAKGAKVHAPHVFVLCR